MEGARRVERSALHYYLAARLIESENSEQKETREIRRRCKQRKSIDILDISDIEFKNRFRLTKDAFIYLCDKIRRHTALKSTKRISLELKVLCALSFYATGSYQRLVGMAKHLGQTTVSKYVREVTAALISPAIMNLFIKFPQTREQRDAVKNHGGSKDARKPIDGFGPRIINIFKNNFRGLLGVLVPIIFCTWRVTKGKSTLEFLWMTMFWFYLIQPIAVPCTGLGPIFLLPMTGLMASAVVCKCYFNEGIALLVLSSMVILLLNNSGFDRRLILKMLCSGSEPSSYSSIRLLIKCSFAAFLLSMLSNRLITTAIVTTYITPIFTGMASEGGTNYKEVRYVINNAIQTSASIGSIGIMHSAYCTLAFRAIFIESCTEKDHQFPDIFNYLQYSLFTIPMVLVMFICNLIYHIFLMKAVRGQPMSDLTRTSVKNQIIKYKDGIPKQTTLHEYDLIVAKNMHDEKDTDFKKLSIFFLIFLFVLLCTRATRFGSGWSSYNAIDGKPLIKDVSIVAIFVYFMHCLPKGFGFTKVFTENKKSKLTMKPESTILFWRFVNANVNYGYMLVLGSGVAVDRAARVTGLAKDIVEYAGAPITNLDFYPALFCVCLVCCLLSNAMTGVAMVACVLPFILSMAREPAAIPWPRNVYLVALAVGIAGSLGFMWPFLHTPGYVCHNVGKVPMLKMAKYSLFPVILCCVILWVALIVYAPVIFDPSGDGFTCEPAAVVGGSDVTTTTTAAP